MIFFIILFGFILRVISINQSLWLDEAINVVAVKTYSLVNLITTYSVADFHPPGYSILLFGWTKIFGYSEFSVRLPSVIFGAITIYLIYLIGKSLKDIKVGILAALLLAINPLHVYYSQEARPYSFAVFSVCLSFYFLINYLKTNRKDSLVYLSLANILVITSDYLAYSVFPAQLFFLIYSRQLKLVKKWIISIIPTLLLFGLWLPFFIVQLQVGIGTASILPEWRDVVGTGNFKSLPLTYLKFIVGRVSFYNKFIYGLVFLPAGFSSAVLIIRLIIFGKNQFKILILSWLLIPTILGFLISFFIPVFSYFRLIFVLPAFILTLSMGMKELKSVLYYLLAGIIVLSQISFTILYLTKPEFQREDWKGAISFLNQRNIQGVLLESDGLFPPLFYYAGNHLKLVGGLSHIPAKDDSDVFLDSNFVSSERTLYLFNYLVDITDPKRTLQKKLEILGYHLNNIYNFNGVGFIYEYSK